MSLADTHLMWRDSVPVTSFPFRYQHRQHGVISQSWAEVKDKLGRDAQSQALPFVPAHIAPSQLQSMIITEMCRKEEQNTRRLDEKQRSAAAARPQSAPVTRQRRDTQTTSGAMASLVAKRTADAKERQRLAASVAAAAAEERELDDDPPAAAAPVVVVSRPQRPMSAVERRVLSEGAGDGTHGRAAYLRLRRGLPVQHRTNFRRTSSQAYGWELLDMSDAAVAPQQQEAAVLQAVGQRIRPVPTRSWPGGIAVEGATIASAAAAENRRHKPVPEFNKAILVGGPPPPAAAPNTAAAPPGNGSNGATAGGKRASVAAAADGEHPMQLTAIGTMARVHASGHREPGQAHQYYGRRSYMKQLSRRTGVFSKGGGD